MGIELHGKLDAERPGDCSFVVHGKALQVSLCRGLSDRDVGSYCRDWPRIRI